MPLTQPSGLLADELHDGLTADLGAIPALPDLSGEQYQFPSDIGSPLAEEAARLTEADLTTRKVDGTGMFDALMASVGAHLKGEFEKNRITGSDYAQAYVSLTQAALGSAVQYLLSRDQSMWQTRLIKEQARLAATQVIVERTNLELSKVRVTSAQYELQILSASYALSKMKLSTEDAQFRSLEAQVAQTTYQTTSLLPAELAQVTAQTSKVNYEVVNLLPKELEKSNKAIESLTAQISQTTAQKDQILYQTSAILPAQKTGIDKENDIKIYQLNSVLPAQVAGMTADTAVKTYNKDFLMPSQKKLVDEQYEAQRAQTKDTRSDNSAVTGSVGKQKQLYDQQIDSYKRDAESKVVKMLLDTWITQKSIDEGLVPPTQLADAQINSAMTKLRTNLTL